MKYSIQQVHTQNVKRPVGLASGHGVQNTLCRQPEVQPLVGRLALMKMLALMRMPALMRILALMRWRQLGCPYAPASVGSLR